MLKRYLAGLFLGALAFSTAARADGVITKVGRCQTIFVVSTAQGYGVVERASGPVPAKGDTLVGTLATIGRRDIALANGTAVGILIETYGMNLAAATQMLKNECGLQTGLFGIRPRAQ